MLKFIANDENKTLLNSRSGDLLLISLFSEELEIENLLGAAVGRVMITTETGDECFFKSYSIVERAYLLFM